MLRTKLLFIALSSLILFGCSDNDSFDKFLGYWKQQEGGGRHNILLIERDGETILMHNNYLDLPDAYNDGIDTYTLEKNEGRLSINTGFRTAQLALNEDSSILRFVDAAYKRISESEALEEKLNVQNKIAEQKRNKKLCQDLWSDYMDQYDFLGKQEYAREVRIEKREALKGEFKARQSQIPNCNLIIF